MTCSDMVCWGCRAEVIDINNGDTCKQCSVCSDWLCVPCQDDSWAKRPGTDEEACQFCMGERVREVDLLNFARIQFGAEWFQKLLEDYRAAHPPPHGFVWPVGDADDDEEEEEEAEEG